MPKAEAKKMVLSLFHAVLLREPLPAELLDWSQLLEDGVTPEKVLREFLGLKEVAVSMAQAGRHFALPKK